MSQAAYGAGYVHGWCDQRRGGSAGFVWGVSHNVSTAWWLGYDAGREACLRQRGDALDERGLRHFRSPRRRRHIRVDQASGVWYGND